MKKYLLGTLAILVAITFSAFTEAGKTRVTNGKLTLAKYHRWYSSEDGSTVSSILYDNATAIDRDQLVDMQIVPCEPSTGVVCARGSDDFKSVSQPLPSQGTDSDIQRDVQ